MKYYVNLGRGDLEVDVQADPAGGYRTMVGERQQRVHITRRSATDVTVHLGNRVFDWVLAAPAPDLAVAGSGVRINARVQSDRARALEGVRRGSAQNDDGKVKSPMPGKVVKLLVAEGDTVQAGVPVVVVEAMKMENELCAPRDGTVKKVFVAEGDTVEGSAALLTIS